MSRRNNKGWMSLGLCVVAIAVVWMLVLPWIGARPSLRAKIDHLDRRGIDPAALYYTDLEVMQRLESDLATITREHPEAFWAIDAGSTE